MITMFWKFEYWLQITEENVILTTMTPLQINWKNIFNDQTVK